MLGICQTKTGRNDLRGLATVIRARFSCCRVTDRLWRQTGDVWRALHS